MSIRIRRVKFGIIHCQEKHNVIRTFAKSFHLSLIKLQTFTGPQNDLERMRIISLSATHIIRCQGQLYHGDIYTLAVTTEYENNRNTSTSQMFHNISSKLLCITLFAIADMHTKKADSLSYVQAKHCILLQLVSYLWLLSRRFLKCGLSLC